MSDPELETPPVGEEIHLPGPTPLPIINAVGIVMMIIGTTTFWWISAVGGVTFIITAALWIRDTRRDMSELPEEHVH